MDKVKVSLRGVVKRFGDVLVNDHIDLDILDGEFLTLLGSSGSGKSTLMRIIAGLEPCDSGTVSIDGRDVTVDPPRKRNLGMVFQQYSLFPHMTVAENVAYPLKVKGWGGSERSARVAEMLDLVRLPDLASRYPSQLSGGQQQRVALARALAPSPRVLMLDEPLGALDLKLRRQLQVELKRIHQETGTTFLFVTHDQEEALSLSDRVAVLRDGRIEQIGDTMEIYGRPTTDYVADFIGDVSLVECHADPAADASTTVRLAGSEHRIQLETPPPAARFRLVVRPEHVSLSTRADAPGFQGTITDLGFEGGSWLYVVALDDGPVLKARLLGIQGAQMARGARVRAKVSGADVCLPAL